MVRVARPGGLITVQDQDFGSLTLDHPDRALTARIMDGVVGRMYPDPFSGRTIFGRLVRLGLRQVRLVRGGVPGHEARAIHARHAQAAGRERDTAWSGQSAGGRRVDRGIERLAAAANSPSHSTITRPGE
jgi:hypothetical protein